MTLLVLPHKFDQMKKFIFTIFTFSILLTSCSSEDDLNTSIFIDDPQLFGLPAYSEWGYNTFGAYFDRKVVRSNQNDVPLKITVTDDTTSFIFSGYLSYEQFKITIKTTRLIPATYQELTTLNGQSIDLSASDVKLELENEEINTAELLNGTFEFKKVQELKVDEVEQGMILSGIFEFQILINGEPTSVSDGRFDSHIDQRTFFRY